MVNILTFLQFPARCGTIQNRHIFTQTLIFTVNDYTSFTSFGIILFVQLMSIINLYVGIYDVKEENLAVDIFGNTSLRKCLNICALYLLPQYFLPGLVCF
jgi:uncharacterized protein YjfI (DUF2170 family)